jgi:hypothetical protein
MAVNLARSFLWWHKDKQISFYLATDKAEFIPKDVLDKIQIINIFPGQYGQGFSTKLHLDKLAPTPQTLFIDADCLITGNLSEVFERFQNHAVSVVGSYISEGEWFGDIAAICRNFNLPAIPKFNGGIYYIERGETASKIYETARRLEPDYDKIGFIRLRNKPNDEVLMALAMALHQQKVTADDGTIMSDPQACQGRLRIDVIDGVSVLSNPRAPHPKHQPWYPFQEVNPVVVHFLGGTTNSYFYLREKRVLELVQLFHLPVFLAKLWADTTIALPSFLQSSIKDTFRPIYHHFFGVRQVKMSDRT